MRVEESGMEEVSSRCKCPDNCVDLPVVFGHDSVVRSHNWTTLVNRNSHFRKQVTTMLVHKEGTFHSTLHALQICI